MKILVGSCFGQETTALSFMSKDSKSLNFSLTMDGFLQRELSEKDIIKIIRFLVCSLADEVGSTEFKVEI